MARATRRHDNGRLELSMYPTTMPNVSLRLPSAIVAFALLLACASATASAPGATAAASFQRDLVAILECRADPATTQRIGNTLRAAMYGDAQQRPAHLRDWRFQRGGDEDRPFTTIDMPAPLKAQGITTRRVFVDDLGMSMPIDGAQRERIVATHALRLRSSTLHEPFSVWSRPVVAGEKPLPAAVVVRSDGDGYRLGATGLANRAKTSPPRATRASPTHTTWPPRAVSSPLLIPASAGQKTRRPEKTHCDKSGDRTSAQAAAAEHDREGVG